MKEVVAFALQREDKFLLEFRTDPPFCDKWSFPGGKIEMGERAYDALHREMREELGVEPLSVIPLDQMKYNGYTIYPYWVRDWEGGIPIKTDAEHTLGWFTLARVIEDTNGWLPARMLAASIVDYAVTAV